MDKLLVIAGFEVNIRFFRQTFVDYGFNVINATKGRDRTGFAILEQGTKLVFCC